MSKPKTKQALDIGEYADYYVFKFYCDNCGKHDSIYILKGFRKTSVTITCQNCGCGVPNK